MCTYICLVFDFATVRTLRIEEKKRISNEYDLLDRQDPREPKNAPRRMVYNWHSNSHQFLQHHASVSNRRTLL